MEWVDLILKYLRVLIWPFILIFFVCIYHPEINTLIKNLSEAEKVQFGAMGFEKKKVAELETKVKETKEKKVPPEKTFAVVKTFKEFQKVLMQGNKSELENYFSRDYPNRHDDIKKWGELSKKEISIEVEEIGQYADKIKASIKITIEGEEWEDSVALVMEDAEWKFLE